MALPSMLPKTSTAAANTCSRWLSNGRSQRRARTELTKAYSVRIQERPAVHTGVASAPAPAVVLEPAIRLICGPMFAGKSNHLLSLIEDYRAHGNNCGILVLKSSKDVRYHDHKIVTHNGRAMDCVSVHDLIPVLETDGYKSAQVIAIDEAQFFTDLRDFCIKAADRDGKVVLVAGLDADFRRKQFGQITQLVPLADSVEKLAAGKCNYCERPAIFSLRTISDHANQELIGGSESYAPACRRCFLEHQTEADLDYDTTRTVMHR